MSGVTRAPTRLASGAAVAAGLLAVVATGPYSWLALAAGTGGVLLLVGGLVRGTVRVVTTGGFALLVGALAGGLAGAPAPATLLGAATAVLAWDAGGTAVALGEQLGREAPTRRLELVHLGGSVLAGLLASGVGFGLYRVTTGGQPVAALVFSLVAAVLLVAALD